MKIEQISDKVGIAASTAKKYLHMSQEEIEALNSPKDYHRSKPRAGDAFVNIIYKMMVDGYDDECIYHYLRKAGFSDTTSCLWNYIASISKENFPNRTRMIYKSLEIYEYPPDVVHITRTELLKFCLTTDPKKIRDKRIEDNIDIIKKKYPIVDESVK